MIAKQRKDLTALLLKLQQYEKLNSERERQAKEKKDKKNSIKCYNCQGLGHMEVECLQEKR